MSIPLYFADLPELQSKSRQPRKAFAFPKIGVDYFLDHTAFHGGEYARREGRALLRGSEKMVRGGMMARRLVKLLLVSGLVLLAVAIWKKEALPPPQLLSPELLQEPEQIQVERAAFDTIINGVDYTIRPLYTYHLSGMVVSMHDAKTWWDYIHREWNDHLNVMDLCVIWGNNVRGDNYKNIDYSSGQFVCYVKPNSMEAFQTFDMTALSNNHLLTDNPEVARAIRKVRIGDQVRFRGHLAEYSHNHNGQRFKRGTSIVRTDTGNGACETIYLEDFEILKPGGGPWRKLVWVAALMLIAGVVAWFRLPISVD